jgi:hypothetical protein
MNLFYAIPVCLLEGSERSNPRDEFAFLGEIEEN